MSIYKIVCPLSHFLTNKTFYEEVDQDPNEDYKKQFTDENS